MVAFDTVYMSPRVRVALNSIFQPAYTRKFFELVAKLRSGRFDIKGLNVEKLHTKKGKVYSARLNVEMRVIFSMYSKDSRRCLVIWDVNHHDDAYSRVGRAVCPFLDESEMLAVSCWGEGASKPLAELSAETKDLDSAEATDGLLLFEVPHFVLAEPNKYQTFERNIDRYLRLTQEQEELISRTDKAYLVQGSAGTGKTTLALFHALNLYEYHEQDDIFFFTYQDELACVCRCYKVNLTGQEEVHAESGGLKVFSYLEFCRHYLRKNLNANAQGFKWIDKQTSLNFLAEIIASKSRWARTIQPEDTYSYIYSILKGRFVPGTDKFPENLDDYKRIFKGYGITPDNLDEIMDIFDLYQGHLARSSKRDEADLIRFCYQSMKDTHILSGESKATWIVIDEIQDFSELEWKSILLFWGNKGMHGKDSLSFPFLSGDKNQNISRSGFRWQEVDSYVEAILKNMHRPNALVKVKLLNNFRNTIEIFNLGKFIADVAPDRTDDIGAPPKFSASKPRLVIGDESVLVNFLSNVGAKERQLPAPLVVLCENDADLKSLRKQLPIEDGLFLMPQAKSKGMEFEDCIVYRLFSSGMDPSLDDDLRARLHDLWYMTVTRARKNLLIYLTDEDWKQLSQFLGARCAEFESLVLIEDKDPQASLNEFYDSCEKYLPNYNVIFLERVKADEAWRESRNTGNDAPSAHEKEMLGQQALRLWKKCRDWSSLGKAYKELGEFEAAIPYLKLSNQPMLVAHCYRELKQWEQAAQYFEEGQDGLSAAHCLVNCQQYLRAAEIFDIEQQFLPAAENYTLAGDSRRAAVCYEKAGMWQASADCLQMRGEWLAAAKLYDKCNQPLKSAQMYLKLKDKLDAARSFRKAGEPLRAVPLLESLNRWQEAGECYEELAMWDKAAAQYARVGKLKEVARCAEKALDWSKAALAHERMKNWDQAGENYLKAGLNTKAAECFENAANWIKALPLLTEQGDWKRLARCCEKIGDLASAAEYYLKERCFNEAAYCFERGEQWEQALEYYGKANNMVSTSSILIKLGRHMEAAKLVLLSGQVKAALELVKSVADPCSRSQPHDLRLQLAVFAEQKERLELAAAVYEHTGQMMLAGQRYKQAAMPEKAAECFQSEKKYMLAADLYKECGRFAHAGNCYKLAKQWKKAAQCFEQAKSWAEAHAMYRQCGDEEGARRCQSSSQWF